MSTALSPGRTVSSTSAVAGGAGAERSGQSASQQQAGGTAQPPRPWASPPARGPTTTPSLAKSNYFRCLLPLSSHLINRVEPQRGGFRDAGHPSGHSRAQLPLLTPGGPSTAPAAVTLGNQSVRPRGPFALAVQPQPDVGGRLPRGMLPALPRGPHLLLLLLACQVSTAIPSFLHPASPTCRWPHRLPPLSQLQAPAAQVMDFLFEKWQLYGNQCLHNLSLLPPPTGESGPPSPCSY